MAMIVEDVQDDLRLTSVVVVVAAVAALIFWLLR